MEREREQIPKFFPPQNYVNFFFLSQEINSLAILPETNHVYCSRQERTSFILNFTHTINFTYLYLNREPIRKKFCLAEGPLTGPLSLKNA